MPSLPPEGPCCTAMGRALEADRDDPDGVLRYSARFDEYAIPIHDGGLSAFRIAHCPFCGRALPPSRRDDWFDAVEAEGVTDALVATPEDLPAGYDGADWRRDEWPVPRPPVPAPFEETAYPPPIPRGFDAALDAACCPRMERALENRCEQHDDPFECGDMVMAYDPGAGRFGLIRHGGGRRYVGIAHCPWCGSALG